MDTTPPSKKRTEASLLSNSENKEGNEEINVVQVEPKKLKPNSPRTLSPFVSNSQTSFTPLKAGSFPASDSIPKPSPHVAGTSASLSSTLVSAPIPGSPKFATKPTSPAKVITTPKIFLQPSSPKEIIATTAFNETFSTPSHSRIPLFTSASSVHKQELDSKKSNVSTPTKSTSTGYGFMSFANPSSSQNSFSAFSSFQNSQTSSIFSHSSSMTPPNPSPFSWTSAFSKKEKNSAKNSNFKDNDDDEEEEEGEREESNDEESSENEKDEHEEILNERDVHVQSKSFSAIQPIETGEENETVTYSVRAKLYISQDKDFKEKGVGTLKINVQDLEDGKQKARLVMRSDNVYKLLLNCVLLPGMKCVVTDSYVRFVAIEQSTFTNYLFKLSNPNTAEELAEAILKYTSCSSVPQSSQSDTETP